MAVTGLRGRQILDDSVVRGDLNTTTAGDAVIRKIIAGTGISISSTGVDAGTGDVTISTTATILNGTGFVRMSGTTVSYVTGSATSFVKADGSLDGNVYALSSALNNYLPLAGGTLTGQLINTRANATGDGTGQIYLNGANGNRIDWGSAGIGAPTFTTRSVGTKLVLYAGVSATSADYGIGIDNNTLWFSVPTTSLFFRFYGGTTVGATLTGAGALTLSSTLTATQIIRTGGTSTEFLKADGSIDSSTYMVNPMTTVGDIIYGGAAGAATRLAAGTAGQALVSAGAAAPVWTTLTLENLPDAWVKIAVKVATTANITLSGTQTIDGIAVVAGDRVLVKDQTTTSQNGIYIVAAGAWTRSADADTSSEIAGSMVAVDQGTVNGGLTYDNDFRSTDTLGTTAMLWNRVVDTGYTIPVTQGGTGATTLTGVMVGNGTSAVTAVAGSASQLLRRNAGNTGYEFFTHDFASTAGATFTGQIISSRAWNAGAGLAQIYLNGNTGNRIDFNANGFAAPTLTTISTGTKIILYPAITATTVDYALGIDASTLWFSVPSTTAAFRFYGATTLGATLTGAGALTLSSTATATQFIRTGGTASQFLKADGSVDSTTYLSAEVDTLATVTGRGATTTTAIGAPNYYDATGTYNVNLGSGGTEGRGLVAGYSGASYGGIGYNVRHSVTSATYIAPSTDTANYLLFNQGFTFYHAAAGTAGRTLSWSTLAILSATGQFRLNSYTSSTAFTGTAVANLAVDASGNVLTTATAVTSVGLSLPAIFTVTGSPVTTSGTLTATLASQAANSFLAAPNGSAGTPSFRTIAAGDIPQLNQNTAGYATTLLPIDDRVLAPADLATTRIAAGFGSWANNNTSPYADYLHFRSYTDATGGNDNLVMFRKDGVIGMRIYTQTYGSATAYSTFRDVALLSATGSTNVLPKFTSATNLGNSNISDDGTTVVVNYPTFQVSTTQAGAGVTAIYANNIDSTAAVTHASRFATQQLGSGLARTLIYAASNTTGVTRGQLAVLTENGGNVIMQLGTNVTSSDYALSVHNIAGTETIRLNSNGNSFINGGNIGIGDSSPGALIDAYKATLGIIRVRADDGGAFYVSNSTKTATIAAFGDAGGIIGGAANATALVYSGNNIPLVFHINGSERARFTTTGNVTYGTNGFFYDDVNKRLGIGVTGNPSQVLDVAAPFAIAKFTSSTGTNAAFFQFTNTGGSFYLGMEGSTSGSFGATAYAGTIYTSAGVPIEFMPAATKRAELKTTGQFRLNAYTATTSFSGTVAGYLAFDASGNILTAGAPGGSTQWTTSGANIYYSGGNVTIGSSASNGRLNVVGGALATGGTGMMVSTDLTTGRLGTFDAGSLASIHSFLDASSYEIAAGSTSGWVSGITMTGNNATNNPGTVRVFTASAERARWNVSGDMGLGTTSITNTANYTSLQINGTSGGLLRFSYGGTNAGHVYGSSAEVGINSASVFNVYISNSQKFNANATEVNAYETFYARKLGAQIQLAGGVATASGIFQPGSNLMTIGDWATGTNGITLDVSNGILYSRSSQANGAYLIFQRSGSTDYGYIGNSAQLFGAGFNGNTELGIRSAGAINFATAGGVAIARIQTTGQLRLPLYTTATTFTGTAVGYLAFDSSGNILTTAAPTGGGITFSEVTTTTQTAAVNTGYIANNAALVTITLPATCALGSVIEIVGKGAGLWRLAQPTGNQIRFGNLSTTAGTGGWLQATHRYDSIRLVCTVADTEWTVVSVQGVIDVN